MPPNAPFLSVRASQSVFMCFVRGWAGGVGGRGRHHDPVSAAAAGGRACPERAGDAGQVRCGAAPDRRGVPPTGRHGYAGGGGLAARAVVDVGRRGAVDSVSDAGGACEQVLLRPARQVLCVPVRPRKSTACYAKAVHISFLDTRD